MADNIPLRWIALVGSRLVWSLTNKNPIVTNVIATNTIVDGVTAATVITNVPVTTASWDMLDWQGNPVSKGVYRVWVEVCVRQRKLNINGGEMPYIYSNDIDMTGGSTNVSLLHVDSNMTTGTVIYSNY